MNQAPIYNPARYVVSIFPTLTPDNAVQILDDIYSKLWQPYQGKESVAVKKFRSNPFKAINSILVHHDAMLWYGFHERETWNFDIEDALDDNGYLVTEFCCHIDYDTHISYTVLSYFGTHCGYEAYEL